MRYALLLSLLASSLFGYESTHLLSLYNGLDPNSITQHIALYKLYPDEEIGKKAYAHAEALLKKQHLEKDTLKNLPLLNQSIDGFVSFMLGKDIVREYLDESYLDAIETLSSHLYNRKLKGYSAQSQEEVLALEDQEIDLARGILLAQQEEDVDWVWIRNYEAQLDFLALQVLARLDDNPSPKDIIRQINHILFFDLKVRFPNQYIQNEHQKFSQLSQVLDLKQGVCLGTTIVYLCLAQRLNLPLEIITPPGHIFARYNDSGKITNIETTHRGVHVPSDHYYNVNLKYLKQVNHKQTIAAVYHNLATTSLMDGKYKLAQSLYQKALRYSPDEALYTLLLGYSYAFNKEPKEAKKTFQKLKTLKNDDQISPIDLYAYQDYLSHKVSLEGLKAAVLPEQNPTLEQLEKSKVILEKELQKNPNFCAGLHMLSNIYNQLSEPKKAIQALEHIHKINPSIPIIEFNLALLYNENMNIPKAWQHYQNCAEILRQNDVDLKLMSDVKKMFKSASIEPV